MPADNHIVFSNDSARLTRKSPITGELNTRTMDIDINQWAEWKKPDRGLIQNVFPNLTDEEREFIKSGMTQQDWDTIFPPDMA